MSRLYKPLMWTAIAVGVVYFASMVVIPLYEGNSWSYLQGVWYSWQSLNVGVLAFISSVIALRISAYNAEQQRKRDFTAARAFLPEALSELTGYCKSCSVVLIEAYHRLRADPVNRTTSLQAVAPALPTDFKEVFGRCISHAAPEVGDYFAKILARLQIHHSRIKELEGSFSPDRTLILTTNNVITYIFALVVIQAMINNLYGFARNMEQFSGHTPTEDDLRTAFGNWDHGWIEDYQGFAEELAATVAREVKRTW